MFDWITGKKGNGNLTLSAESRARLDAIAKALTAQTDDADEVTPLAVIEHLLQGQLALVSPQAAHTVSLAAEGITLDPVAAEVIPAAAPVPPPLPTVAAVPAITEPVPTPQPAPEDSPSPEVAMLRQQLADLQTKLNQRRDQQAAYQVKYTTLARKSQKQQQEIEALQAQLEQLRQAAAIGEAQLNRWRFNNFSR